MASITVKRALLSVYDKTGIADFARALAAENVEILSTGGTYSLLEKEGVPCIKIEDFTGAKEIFGGRVKTLHPLIHGGILSFRDKESEDLGMKTIDLVVVNLYPFEMVMDSGEKDIDKLIEMIDIGGPTMLRAAAKNYKYVCPVNDPSYYEGIIEEMKSGGISEETRLQLAVEVFRNTAYYDAVISRTLFPELEIEDRITLPLRKVSDLRYGENPHQSASYFGIPVDSKKDISRFMIEGKLHGKELSYNNIADISAAIRIAGDLPDGSCVVLKHSNPCGAAVRDTVHESFMAAYEGDKVSIFGGIVILRGKLTKNTAEVLSSIFLEIVIAESFDDEAFDILSKKKNIRLMHYAPWKNELFKDDLFFEIKRALGGVLLQRRDKKVPGDEEVTIATEKKPSQEEMEDLIFGQTLVKHVKSNAIVVVKDKMLIGVGAGQMNRVTAAKIALDWAGEKSKGAVLASDAFFPMSDTVELAAERGITAIIQPGGSIRDEDSVKACNDLEVSMVMTGTRHFYH